ncbi:MAG: SMI1/KNR4 family protein [Phenylobacterium sp.]
MSIESLLEVVPPPQSPFEGFNGPWEPVEAELRLVLPPDYKDFVRLYGSGYFMEFLGICVPRTTNPNTRLEAYARVVCEATYEDDKLDCLLWPRTGGLLPFGSTDNGDTLFWLTRGQPAEWPVVVWDRGLGDLESFECDLTDFLASLASGGILPKEFPETLRYCDHLFQPNQMHGDE